MNLGLYFALQDRPRLKTKRTATDVPHPHPQYVTALEPLGDFIFRRNSFLHSPDTVVTRAGLHFVPTALTDCDRCSCTQITQLQSWMEWIGSSGRGKIFLRGPGGTQEVEGNRVAHDANELHQPKMENPQEMIFRITSRAHYDRQKRGERITRCSSAPVENRVYVH